VPALLVASLGSMICALALATLFFSYSHACAPGRAKPGFASEKTQPRAAEMGASERKALKKG